MTSVQVCKRLRRNRFSITLFNSSTPPELEFFDQPTASAIAPAATLVVFKSTKKDLQQTFKTVLEAQAPTSIKKPWNKLLKAHSPDIYRRKFHMECYNFCQQCEEYFTTAEVRKTSWIFFVISFFWDQITFHWQ